jgi:hypothetical protein
MNEPEIDIETLRRSRTDRLAEWLEQAASPITHIGWHTAPAKVTACRPVRKYQYYTTHYPSFPILTGYIVEFSYVVNGRTFTGVLDSPVEVQPGDTFDIRYNPANPQENNSLGSSGDSGARIATLTTSILLLVVLITLLIQLLRRFALFHP